MPVQVRHKRADLNARRNFDRQRIDPRTRDNDHSQFGYLLPYRGIALEDAPDEVRSHCRSPHCNDTDALVRTVSKALAKLLAISECLWMLSDDVACKVEMLRHPVTHRRKTFTERQRCDVVRF